MTKKWLWLLIYIFCLVLTLWPLISEHFFFTHDFVHGARIAEYARGLADGQLPVVWSKNFGYGYGMPLFLFYAPLPYFLGSLLFLASFDLVLIVKILYVLLSLIGSLGMFLVVDKLFGRTSAYVSSIVYILAPYKALNLYVRGAVSEAFGLAFAPFVLLGVWLSWQKKWFGVPILALSLLAVGLSHNLSLLLILPVASALILYLIIEFYYYDELRSIKLIWSKLSLVVWGLILGLGSLLFYLIPAAAYQNLTKVQQIVLSGYSDYRHHFLYIRQLFDSKWGYGGSNWGPSDDMSFFLGYAPLFTLGFVIGYPAMRIVFILKNKAFSITRNELRIVFFVLLSAVCLLFTTPKLLLVWQNLPILSVLQFPWRFLGPVSMLLAIVAGGQVILLKNKCQKIFLLIIVLLSILAGRFFQPNGFLNANEDLYYENPEKIASHMSGILPDYIAKSLPDDILPPTNAVWSVSSPVENIKIIDWQSNLLVAQVDNSQPTDITFSITQFPGWQVQINNEISQIKSNDIGLITVHLLPGLNNISIRYHLTELQKISLLISCLSLLVLALVSYHEYTKSHAT